MKKKKNFFILASASPRRKELLHQIGLSFTVAPADVDERVFPAEKPRRYAERLAREKARIAAQRAGKEIIIAADTIVVIDGTILGKPADRREAKRMLSLLSGRMHRVITGLAVVNGATGFNLTGIEVTKVWFRKLSRNEITWYVDTGEPLDKAGAYGIQEKGALLVSRIDGCYSNVVGLPLSLLGQILRSMGISIE